MNRAAIVSNTITAPQFDRPARSSSSRSTPPAATSSTALGNLPQMGGAAATDYTVYTKKDLTLRRGEKAILTLFTAEDQATRTSIAGRRRAGWSTPWCCTTQTDTAWTTGPCLAVSDERPLSEDLLKYTPKGGNGELPVTAAINIAHEKTEREIDRKLKAHSPAHNVYFDLVTLEGKLKLRNYEKRRRRDRHHQPVPGKPTEADDDGAISVDPTKLKLLERAGSIRWTVKLEAGRGEDA